jgi:uncharacterized protein YceH (UPF0502 family)
MKYEHLLTEKLRVDGAELAVLCVLMLRGAQTVGEIKGRTARLHEFASLAELDDALRRLTEQSLVVELPRRPGQKEVRYAHTLSPQVDETARAGDQAATPTTVIERSAAEDDRLRALEDTVAQLRSDLVALQSAFDDFKRQFS